jgi:hypothetical protein
VQHWAAPRAARRAPECQIQFAGAGLSADAQIDEQVIGIGHPLDGSDLHARIAQRGQQLADLRAMHHQLQAALVHAGPPAGRFHVIDAVIGAGAAQSQAGEGGQQQALVHAVSIFR